MVVLGILPQLLYSSGKDPKAQCKRGRMALRSSVNVVVHAKTFDLKELVDFLRRMYWNNRSRCPRGLRRESVSSHLLGLLVRILRGGIDVCLLWILCVVQVEVSGSGPIPRPKESFRMCVCVCARACVPPNVIKRKNKPPRPQWVAGRKDRPRKKPKKMYWNAIPGSVLVLKLLPPEQLSLHDHYLTATKPGLMSNQRHIFQKQFTKHGSAHFAENQIYNLVYIYIYIYIYIHVIHNN